MRLRAALCAVMVALALIAALLLVARPELALALNERLRIGPPPELAAHFDAMRTHLRRVDTQVPPGAVLIIGDSHVQSLWAPAVHARAVNYGIGGDTSVGVAARLADYASLPRAAALVLAVGYNDLKRREPAQLAQHYGELLQRLPPHLPVVCSGLLPIDERVRPDLAGLSERIRRANLELARLCSSPPHRFVDMQTALADADGQLERALHDGDGVHLNARGYALWTERLREALAAGGSAR
jgi:lysophospholipase L1-like esterase